MSTGHYPMDGWAGYIEVFSNGASYQFQRATALLTTNLGGATNRNLWVRSRTSGVWAAWTPVTMDLKGTGSPEGVVSAAVGTYYTDTAGTNGIWRYIKRTGTGNTGWVAENIVEATTKTNLTGVLMGNGSLVSATSAIPVLKNLLTNSDFSGGTTGWTGSQGTVAANAGILSLTGTSGTYARLQQTTSAFIQGRVYYLRARVRVPAGCTAISTSDGVTVLAMFTSPPADTWLNVSIVLTAKAAIFFTLYEGGFADSTGKVMDVDYATCIDLTTIFGAGMEPTLAEMDAIMATLGNWVNEADPKPLPTYVWEKVTDNPAQNLVVNGDFSNGTTGWAPTSSTISVASNTLTNTGNGTNVAPRADNTMIAETIVGRKYYTRGRVRVTNPDCLTIRFQVGNIPGIAVTLPVQNQWYEASVVTVATGVSNLARLYHYYVDAATSTGKVMEIQRVLYLDLTAIFGAGNEPTAVEMDALLTKYPNSWFNGMVNDLLAPRPRSTSGNVVVQDHLKVLSRQMLEPNGPTPLGPMVLGSG